jgi:hypothetical protein
MVPVPVPVSTFEKLWFRFRFLLLKSYGSGSGSVSNSQKVTVPNVPVPQRCLRESIDNKRGSSSPSLVPSAPRQIHWVIENNKIRARISHVLCLRIFSAYGVLQCWLLYTVKKGLRVSRPQPGCHYQTLPGRELWRHNWIIPAQGEFG